MDADAAAAFIAANAARGLEPEGLPDDPFDLFRAWFDDVVRLGLPEPSAMALATAPADQQARPMARHVLLKGIDGGRFSWVTNYESRKGRHLAANPQACLLFPWFPIGRQVVVGGTVTRASAEESDAYFATRDRGAQIGAWASQQSARIPDRAWLETRLAAAEERYADAQVPRPPTWGMFHLVPDSVEFWQNRPARLHDRILYEREGPHWKRWRLAP